MRYCVGADGGSVRHYVMGFGRNVPDKPGFFAVAEDASSEPDYQTARSQCPNEVQKAYVGAFAANPDG